MQKFVPWESRRYKSGDKFHKLTILSTAKETTKKLNYALCQCDCGSEPIYVRLASLATGNTGACGCSKVGNFKHGLRYHPLYSCHVNMMHRCYSPKNKRFAGYGGRGITVCKRWHKLQNFIEDMELTYEDGLSIDRIDNDKGYSPKNCRWAEKTVQYRNRRNNNFVTHNGKTLCKVDWAKEASISITTLNNRLRRGMSFEEAVNSPLYYRK